MLINTVSNFLPSRSELPVKCSLSLAFCPSQSRSLLSRMSRESSHTGKGIATTVRLSVSCSLMSDFLQPHGLQPTRLLCLWDFPGKNTGVACHSFLQGIFLIQGYNPGFPYCRQIPYHLSHQEALMEEITQVLYTHRCAQI